ncbi:hypothetical protein CDAR_205971 [Caerostris darwini]|uniref:Uncharacterized protein n=1 Tax=Caerostris darwini TaxID=1538125 RepID=A0AAV4QLR6_9ARAC|nr:hypothetical protein CDAR_205971 [Caerostris darwini]
MHPADETVEGFHNIPSSLGIPRHSPYSTEGDAGALATHYHARKPKQSKNNKKQEESHRASQAFRHCWHCLDRNWGSRFLRRTGTSFTYSNWSDQWLFSIGSADTLFWSERTQFLDQQTLDISPPLR